MLTQRTTVHKTKRGRILRHITEHYLRDDIYCGFNNCPRCQAEINGEFPQKVEKTPYCIKKSNNNNNNNIETTNASVFELIQSSAELLLEQRSKLEHIPPPKQGEFTCPSLQSVNLKHFLTKFTTLLQSFTHTTNTTSTKTSNNNQDGTDEDESNDTLLPQIVLIPEVNIFLQQYDFLETQTIPFSNMIILQSVLNFLQRKHYKIYQKLRALCTTTTFQSSTLLKSNFESKSFSIGNSSQEQTITPYLYVFSDLHHQDVYSSAVAEVGDITEDILIPYGIDASQIQKSTKGRNNNDTSDDDSDNDEIDDKNFMYPPRTMMGDSDDDEDEAAQFLIPKSFVQYVDVEINPDDPHQSNSANTITADSEQTFEQRYLSELFLSTNKWFHRHQTNNTCVLGLTTDLQGALRHIELGIPAIPIDLYIYFFLQFHPGYESLYARGIEEQQTRDRSQWVYQEHLTPQQIESGLVSGSIYSGKLNIDRDYWSQGSISTEEHGRVLIPGFQYMNRAFDGDLVAVKLWPKELWHELATGLAPDIEKDETPAAKSESLQVISTLSDGILDGTEHKFNQVSEDYIPTVEQQKNNDNNTMGDSALQDSINQRNFVPTGEVVGIIQQGTRTFCGSIEFTDKNEGHVLLLPHNRRIPKIFIHSRQLQTLVSSRLLVRVDSWPITSRHPNGHITRILGNIGDNEAETEMVLIEHDVKHDKWSLEVEKCLPPPDYVIDDQERAGRVDLRGINICSIDPPGCTDIDDALHAIRLPNGNYEVGVHIADVTHYMKPGSALDIEAAKRSTSVYLVDRRIDMIPARLSTNLCSLHEHVERLAFSTVWELTPEADIVGVKFFKSVIESRGAMTYAQAQERIDLEPEHCTTPELKALYDDKLTQPCKDLMMLAKKIKQKRFDKGALSLASTEVKFKLNQDRTRAEDMLIYQLKDANSLVEEFMLLANVSVAEHTLRYFPLLALLRGHPTPPEEMLLPLVKAAKSWGYEVDISNGKTISSSLDNIVDPTNPMFNKVLRVLTTRCMTQAKYMSSGEIANLKQLHHFGLAATTYTHFTSPIRRYADCIVHRLLATSLGIHPLPEAIKDKAHMRDVVENLNFRHRNAQMASRASTDLWILKFFTGKDVIADAIVLAVRSTGIRVIVQQYGIECAVRLVPAEFTKQVHTVHFDTVDENNKETPQDGYYYNPELMTLTLNGVRFQALQQVQVRLCVKENKARRRWLHVELAGKSQDMITTDLIQTLHHETLQDSIDITPELLKQREEEAKMYENGGKDDKTKKSAKSIINTDLNTGSAEMYLDASKPLNDEMFKPLPCDDEIATAAGVDNDTTPPPASTSSTPVQGKKNKKNKKGNNTNSDEQPIEHTKKKQRTNNNNNNNKA